MNTDKVTKIGLFAHEIIDLGTDRFTDREVLAGLRASVFAQEGMMRDPNGSSEADEHLMAAMDELIKSELAEDSRIN